MSTVVALVGRPNVGKSTLFNRLVEQRQAIVYEEPGVTRDRQYGEVQWCGKQFTLIDTGGYLESDVDRWSAPIRAQVQEALSEADLLLFILDSRSGLLAADHTLAELLRKISKPILLIANKSEQIVQSIAAADFYTLGIGEELFEVSAVNGAGTGDMLDAVLSHLPKEEYLTDSLDQQLPRFVILGRPNVGKSTLLNTLVGKNRSIVSEEAGTTRDALSTHYKHYGKELLLIDTAGLRKRAKAKENIEFFSSLRAISALQKSDVCLLLIDAREGLRAQDLHLLSLAERYHKGILLCVNKWDLVPKDTHTQAYLRKEMQQQLGELAHLPIHFCSATEKQGIYQLVEQGLSVYVARKQHIPTPELNTKLLKRLTETPPPAYRGKPTHIKYITQLKKPYPHFILFANRPQYIPLSYGRFIQKCLRKQFGFGGVPLLISFRKK